jgi:spermidine/putrescine transport system permease protein
VLGRRGALAYLAVPPYLWLLGLFVLPLLVVVAVSLQPASGRIDFGAGWPSTNQYAHLADTPVYFRQLGLSLAMALGIAVTATLLAYPLAYFLAFRARERAGAFLILLLLPFATSFLLRIMAWKLLLGRDGAINWVLTTTGIATEPSTLLIYSRAAVIITLIYVWIPFAALPIYAALQRIDRSHLEAAGDLGAGPWTRFFRVTVPLSLPGVLATLFMVFIPTVGEYVTPVLVGGPEGVMYGQLVQDFFTRAGNWPLGSALAVVMLLTTLALAAAAVKLIDLRRLA